MKPRLILLLVLIVAVQASRIDNIIQFLTDPSVNNFALIIGSDPWYFLAPYLGGYVAMIAETQFAAMPELAQLGVTSAFVYNMAMDEIYSAYMGIWGFRAQ